MRILFIVEHFYPYIGGVENLFLQLGRSLVKNGHLVHVITTRYDPLLKKEDEIKGIRITRVNASSRYGFSIKSIPSILKALDECDVVHTTTYNAAIPAWVATRIKRKPCILTFHEYWGGLWMKLPFLNYFQRIMYRTFEKIVSKLSFDYVVSVSEFTRQRLVKAGIPEAKLIKIYNGLEYESLTLLPPTEKLKKQIVFVGRLGVSKGLDLFLSAVDTFLETYKDYRAIIIIPQRPSSLYLKIMNIINSSKNKSKLKVLHHLSSENLYQVMRQSDFLVIPSYSEGFCFVAAEACALNIPVVHSGMGALSEVVSGKQIVFTPFSTEGLINGLKQASNNQWNIIPVKKFPLKDTVTSYMNLYLTITGE